MRLCPWLNLEALLLGIAQQVAPAQLLQGLTHLSLLVSGSLVLARSASSVRRAARRTAAKILGNLHKSFFILEVLDLLLQMLQPHLLPACVGFM